MPQRPAQELQALRQQSNLQMPGSWSEGAVMRVRPWLFGLQAAAPLSQAWVSREAV